MTTRYRNHASGCEQHACLHCAENLQSRLLFHRSAVLQFGPGEKMQQHGFARNVEWSVGSTSADLQPDERDPSIELVLSPSEYSDAMFPYKFKVVYTVTLHGEDLQTIYRCAPWALLLLT